MPPYLRVVETSAWENSWNSLPICSSVMPMPVSVTAIVIQSRPSSCCGCAAMVTVPLLGELVGVARQVEQRLPEPGLVGVNRADVRRTIDDDTVAVLRRQRLDRLGDVLDQAAASGNDSR